MKKLLFTASVVFFTGSVFAGVPLQPFGQKDQPLVEVEGRYWTPDLKGKASYDAVSLATEVDLKSDLGVQDENFPEARVVWHTGPASKLRFSYTQAGFDGDQTLTRTIEFNNKTYTAGARVSSELDLQYFGLDWTWQFMNILDTARLGTVIGVKGVTADYTLNAPSLGVSDSDDFIAGLPVLGLSADITPIDRLSVFAELTGMYLGSYGHFFDAETGVKFAPVKYVTVSGGYRIIDIKGEDGSDYAKIRLSGLFASVSVRF